MPNVIQMKKDYLNGTAVFHTLSGVHGAGSKSSEGVWGYTETPGSQVEVSEVFAEPY